MKFRSKLIHAGVEVDPKSGAILTPIYQSSTYVQPSVDEYLSKGYAYSRTGNPTVRALEEKITALEGGVDTACFSSGMAAVHTTMLSLLKAGDHMIISDVAYGGTTRLGTKVFPRFGVDVDFVDTSNIDAVRDVIRKETALVITETPANPTMKLTDIAAVSELTKAKGIPHAVDNTFLTPYFQRPLELGADLVIHSTTKYFDGHNATIGGAVTFNNAEHAELFRFHRNASGSITSPQVAFLTLQGVKTLALRMDAQSASAMKVAQFLETHPKVNQVCYPGLESFSQHALARKQASGFGAMGWFEVKGGVQAGKTLMNSVKLWSLAENLGCVESLVTHPVTMTHADVDPVARKKAGIIDGLVRISVGLEDVDDLIDDLTQGLDKV